MNTFMIEARLSDEAKLVLYLNNEAFAMMTTGRCTDPADILLTVLNHYSPALIGWNLGGDNFKTKLVMDFEEGSTVSQTNVLRHLASAYIEADEWELTIEAL